VPDRGSPFHHEKECSIDTTSSENAKFSRGLPVRGPVPCTPYSSNSNFVAPQSTSANEVGRSSPALLALLIIIIIRRGFPQRRGWTSGIRDKSSRKHGFRRESPAATPRCNARFRPGSHTNRGSTGANLRDDGGICGASLVFGDDSSGTIQPPLVSETLSNETKRAMIRTRASEHSNEGEPSR
jgi:hypothetical protein